MAKPSDLRIISGRYRGRVLRSPAASGTHPMGAREKLALFNMVNVEHETVLDAYAGSGALGLEALSRGAKAVTFVEKSPQVCQIIRQNCAELAGNADWSIFTETLAQFAERPEYQGYFQVIFLDPPYDHYQVAEFAEISSLLQPQGILALSSPASEEPPTLPHLRLSSTHTYARARITIYYKD